jgi:hypothetical protein
VYCLNDRNREAPIKPDPSLVFSNASWIAPSLSTSGMPLCIEIPGDSISPPKTSPADPQRAPSFVKRLEDRQKLAAKDKGLSEPSPGSVTAVMSIDISSAPQYPEMPELKFSSTSPKQAPSFLRREAEKRKKPSKSS